MKSYAWARLGKFVIQLSQFAAVVVSPDERWLAAIELEDWQLM